MTLTVNCRGCGSEHIIKPDRLGFITSSIIFWLIDMKELCDTCRKGEL